jgi:hypothetical protein
MTIGEGNIDEVGPGKVAEDSKLQLGRNPRPRCPCQGGCHTSEKYGAMGVRASGSIRRVYKAVADHQLYPLLVPPERSGSAGVGAGQVEARPAFTCSVYLLHAGQMQVSAQVDFRLAQESCITSLEP